MCAKMSKYQIAQPQTGPSPPSPIPSHPSPFRVPHFEVNLPGWGEHYYQPEVLLSLYYYCTALRLAIYS